MKNQETSKNVIVLIDIAGGYSSSRDITTRSYYSIRNGEISELETLRNTYYWPTGNGDVKSIYEVNGKPVSEEIYRKTINKYANPLFSLYF